MEKNENPQNSKSYLEINPEIQSTSQEQANNPINITKNNIIYRNNRTNDLNKDINGDNLDHPNPLISDFEGREDLNKNLIIQEFRKHENNVKKNKEKNLNDEYFNIINSIEKGKESQNNIKNERNFVRVNLNEVNNILFKNIFKKKIKEVDKNNTLDSKENKKVGVKIHYIYKQNPFKESEIINKTALNNHNNSKKIQKNNYDSNNKTKINYRLIKKNIIKKDNINSNSNIQDSKESQNIINPKQKFSLNEKDFKYNNIIHISGNKNIQKPKIKIISDLNNANKRPYINQIYFSGNAQKKYVLYPKNKNLSNVTSTDADSSKEKNNYNTKTEVKRLNQKEGIQKQTFSNGGVYNNIQTTYVISSKKSTKTKAIIKVNKNPIMNYKNFKINNLATNEISNINNSYDNYLSKTPSKSIDTFKSPRGSNIHICEQKPKRSPFQYYQLNTERNIHKTKQLLLKDKHPVLSHNISVPNNISNNNYVKNSNYKNERNIKNIKYDNIKRNINQNNWQYFNDSTINYDTYNNNTFDNKYSKVPLGNNYLVYDRNVYSKNYNY